VHPELGGGGLACCRPPGFAHLEGSHELSRACHIRGRLVLLQFGHLQARTAYPRGTHQRVWRPNSGAVVGTTPHRPRSWLWPFGRDWEAFAPADPVRNRALSRRRTRRFLRMWIDESCGALTTSQLQERPDDEDGQSFEETCYPFQKQPKPDGHSCLLSWRFLEERSCSSVLLS